MTAFVLIAAAMVAIALAWVLVPLLARHRPERIARETSNVALLREQLRELDGDLAGGALTQGAYEQARRELEQRVLEESKVIQPAPSAPPLAAAWTAALLGGAIPIVALVLYVTLGSHEAFAPSATPAAKGGAEHQLNAKEIEAMAAKLAAKLEREPNNVEGWVTLARTYYAINRHADAVRAFEKASALAPDDAGILADYADSLGAAQGGLSGKALELVDRALKVDPTQWKALALAGTAAFERKDYNKAVEYWERMKATVPAGSPLAGSIDSSIAEARELGGLKAPAAAATPTAPSSSSTATAAAKSIPAASPPSPAAPAAPAAGAPSVASAGTTIAGTVNLAPALAGKVSPTDTVYIFARAAEGPKMPLAIVRKQVKDLPTNFTLDDSMAMAPNFALSNFPAVVVGARVSKSGSASPQSGDLEGISPVVKIGATGLTIVIDRTLP